MSSVPKPTSGYVVVNADWDPKSWPAEGWMPFPTVKEARARQARAEGAGVPKVILKVETVYTLMDGDRG